MRRISLHFSVSSFKSCTFKPVSVNLGWLDVVSALGSVEEFRKTCSERQVLNIMWSGCKQWYVIKSCQFYFLTFYSEKSDWVPSHSCWSGSLWEHFTQLSLTHGGGWKGETGLRVDLLRHSYSPTRKSHGSVSVPGFRSDEQLLLSCKEKLIRGLEKEEHTGKGARGSNKSFHLFPGSAPTGAVQRCLLWPEAPSSFFGVTVLLS